MQIRDNSRVTLNLLHHKNNQLRVRLKVLDTYQQFKRIYKKKVRKEAI
jgi:hypothetical protein